MDVWRITLAALRRWYVLIPLLALTGWGAVLAGDGVHPEYEVSATAMLTPGPAEPTVPNPYGSLNDANQAVGIVLNNAESHEEISAQGLSADYVVTTETRSSIMRLTVRADDPNIAIATGTALHDLAKSELRARQSAAGLGSSSQFSIAVLAPPSVLDVVYEGKTRVQAIVGLIGASIALVSAVLFDDIVGLLKRRYGRRRERRPVVVSTGDPVDAPEERSAESEPGVDDEPRAPAQPAQEHDPDVGGQPQLPTSSRMGERS